MPSVSLGTAEAPFVLALDVGTSSVRVLLYDALGRAVADSEEQVPHEPRTTPDGGAEADAGALFDLVVECIDGALGKAEARAGEIAAVGVSCFWHSLLGLDDDGAPLTPVLMWGDTRSARQVDTLRRELDVATVHQRTGCVIHSSYWPAKLRWLAATNNDQLTRVRRWCSFADYVTRRLHGGDVTSMAMASGTGMLDVRQQVWDEELVAVAGVDRRTMPPIVDRTAANVGLREPFAARWPALTRVPWYPGIGDGACANVGSGAVARGRVALTLGTSGAVRIVVPHAVGEPLTVPDNLWAYRLDSECVLLGAAISNGGSVLAWLGELVGADFGDATMDAVADLPPDRHGLTVLPFLAGERSPVWNDRARGVVAGLTLHTRREDVLQAGMEAVAYRFALLYDNLRPLAAPDHQIVANGGAALRSPVWMGIIADTLGHSLVALPPDEEASARGAALLALEATGVITALDAAADPAAGGEVIKPDARRHGEYAEGRARQQKLERLLYSEGDAWDA